MTWPVPMQNLRRSRGSVSPWVRNRAACTPSTTCGWKVSPAVRESKSGFSRTASPIACHKHLQCCLLPEAEHDLVWLHPSGHRLRLPAVENFCNNGPARSDSAGLSGCAWCQIAPLTWRCPDSVPVSRVCHADSAGRWTIMRRVVVTGIGMVAPTGNTTQQAWAAAVAGRSAVGAHRQFRSLRTSRADRRGSERPGCVRGDGCQDRPPDHSLHQVRGRRGPGSDRR